MAAIAVGERKNDSALTSEAHQQGTRCRRRNPAAVSVPKLEVADILRDHGAAWRCANPGHVSLDQLKVMSAIVRNAAMIDSMSAEPIFSGKLVIAVCSQDRVREKHRCSPFLAPSMPCA
jgi:hypothetical protein